MKNHTRNVVEKLFPDSFLKIKTWAYLWINSPKFYTICFYCMQSYHLLLPHIKFFKKPHFFRKIFLLLCSTNRSNLLLGCHYLLLPHIKFFKKPHFFRKMFLLLCSTNWSNLLLGCHYFVRYWAICVLQLFVNQVVTSWILKLTLSF